ncbi:MAG: acetyl-CoA carboxylase biotin carboxyl carrier protein subunit, partial [Oscillospiraceae bacterium]|nr:acetyl-CoA carboxylase biotin carboxyl carrier protein subunit [Oscillospiraceae bacterium]
MKRFNITVNGKAYDVAVEELDANAPVASAPAAAPVSAPAAAPAPAASAPAPAAAPGTGEKVNAP